MVDEINNEQVYYAQTYGYRFDIGTITPEKKKGLNKLIKQKQAVKVKAWFPYFVDISLKLAI